MTETNDALFDAVQGESRSVYGRIDSAPKTRRWFTTTFDTLSSAFLINEPLPKGDCIRLERLLDAGGMTHIGLGYGDKSFWSVVAPDL